MEQSPVSFASSGVAVDPRRRRRRVATGALIPALAAFAWGWFTLATATPGGPKSSGTHEWLPTLMLAAFLSAVWSAAVLLRLRFDPAVSVDPSRRRAGELALADGRLTVHAGGRSWTYPASSVTEGWIEELGASFTVCLRVREGDQISVDAPHAEGARRMLAALGVSAEQQVVRLRLANVTTQIFGGGCLSVVASVVLTVVGALSLLGVIIGREPLYAALWLAGDLVLFLLLVRALVPPRVTIGADGLTVEHVPTRRFIPFTAITEVTHDAGAVVVVMGHEKLRLPTGERYFGSGGRAQYVTQTALHNRIEEARAAGRHGASADVHVSDLERGGVPFAAFRDRLRGLTSGEAHYRRRAVAPESLAVVLEDAAAPAERRIAAALALSRTEDPHLARRVKDAVATCAQEELRIALAAAAEDELTEQALESATRAEARRR